MAKHKSYPVQNVLSNEHSELAPVPNKQQMIKVNSKPNCKPQQAAEAQTWLAII
jgi:hypothetical protein